MTELPSVVSNCGPIAEVLAWLLGGSVLAIVALYRHTEIRICAERAQTVIAYEQILSEVRSHIDA